MIAVWALLRGLPWRLIGAAGLVVAVALAGWRISTWRDAYRTLPGVQDALDREEACADGSKCYERQRGLQEAAGHATVVAVESYEAELAALRSRPPVRRVIRVCPDPDNLQNASAPGAADGTGPAAGVISGSVEFDTAPLRNLAREADEVAARLRALQQWNEALSAVE